MAVYIDRESTIQAIREIPRGNWSRDRFIAEVMSIPEADVSPVVHAKWNSQVYAKHECSACGFYEVETEYDYCPHCGAKMDL